MIAVKKEHKMTTTKAEQDSAAMDRQPDAANGRSIGTVTTAIMDRMPRDLDGTGEAVGDAMRAVKASVEGAQDDNVLLGASLTAGMSIGLLVGGAPRLLALGTMVTSVVLGATLLERRFGPVQPRSATSTR
jgi:hypothetical protein